MAVVGQSQTRLGGYPIDHQVTAQRNVAPARNRGAVELSYGWLAAVVDQVTINSFTILALILCRSSSGSCDHSILCRENFSRISPLLRTTHFRIYGTKRQS